MEVKCAIGELFNAIKTSHKDRAMELLKKAKEEVELVSKVECINKYGKESLESILVIISQVLNGNMKEAKKKYEKAEKQFSGHVKIYLMQKLKEVNEVKDLPTERTKQKSNNDKNTTTRMIKNNKEEQSNRPNNTGKSQHQDVKGKSQHADDKGKSQHPGDEGKSQHPDDKEKSQHPDDKGKSQHPDDKGKSQHAGDKGKSQHPDDKGKSQHPDDKEKSQHPDDKGKSQHAGDKGKSQHPDDKGKSQHAGDKGKSQHTGDKGKNQHPDNKGKSQHPDGKDRSQLSSSLPDDREKCQFPGERSNAKLMPNTSNFPTNKPSMENNGGSNVEEQGPDDVILRGPQRTAAEKRSSKADDDFKVIEKSKRASQAMRHNNPEIADLSDTNRPTKIAERFSELYDNEWTEAFEELTKKNMTEKEIINYLLFIVKRAYKFCNDTAEHDINLIVKAFDRILEFGPHDFTNKAVSSQSYTRNKEGKGIMIQYRKEIADKAIPRLKEEFKSSIMQEGNKKMGLPAHMKSVDRFAESAVELTWWMCVQDPPVYLCPTDESGEQEFDNNLYKAYTKSGSRPDFFVWPALRLYKDGGVLMKGVVQYL